MPFLFAVTLPIELKFKNIFFILQGVTSVTGVTCRLNDYTIR